MDIDKIVSALLQQMFAQEPEKPGAEEPENASRFFLVPIRGLIVDEQNRSAFSQTQQQTSAENLEQIVERIQQDEQARGVLLRINSPGGLATASHTIYRMFRGLGGHLPVFAHIQGAGASGAYLVALAADRISASPESITGSIGTMLQLTNVSEGLSRIGVSVNLITSGAFKAAGSPFRSQEERTRDRVYFQGLVEKSQGAFLRALRERRKVLESSLRDVRSGKVFLARDALERNLIDAIEDVADAKRLLVDAARKRFDDVSGDAIVWETPKPKQPPLQEFLRGLLGISGAPGPSHELLAFLAHPGPWHLWLP